MGDQVRHRRSRKAADVVAKDSGGEKRGRILSEGQEMLWRCSRELFIGASPTPAERMKKTKTLRWNSCRLAWPYFTSRTTY